MTHINFSERGQDYFSTPNNPIHANHVSVHEIL